MRRQPISAVLDITVRRLVLKQKRLKQPCIDNLRYGLLRTLVSSGGPGQLDETKFADNLGRVVYLMLDCTALAPTYGLLRDIELIALPESDSE